MRSVIVFMCLILSFAHSLSCAKKDDSSVTDIQETAQQVGDMLTSIDESGGSSGNFSLLTADANGLESLDPKMISLEAGRSLSTSCFLSATFGSCTNNVITRTFSDCTMGVLTLNGTVTLTFSDAAVNNTCQMTATGHSITRSPQFSITGRRGATLTVSKSGTNGQVITKTGSSTFTFSNDGIRRVFTAGGSTLFDFTAQTTSDIGISGASRNGRVVSGGTLRVTNNLTGVTCDYSPTAVTWTSSCTCPTSGTLSGSCSDGKNTTVEMTGCGTAKFTLGSESESLTFDRCYGS